MAIKRYEGQPLPIVVSFPVNPLTSYGKTYDDITEITMNLKKNLATDTDTQYLQKTQTGGGVLLDQNNHRFTMVINIGDDTIQHNHFGGRQWISNRNQWIISNGSG